MATCPTLPIEASISSLFAIWAIARTIGSECLCHSIARDPSFEEQREKVGCISIGGKGFLKTGRIVMCR